MLTIAPTLEQTHSMIKTLIKTELFYLKQLFSKRMLVSPIGKSNLDNGQKLILLSSVYLLLNLIIVFVLVYPIDLLFPEIGESYGAMEDFTPFEFMLMAVLLAPPLEEFVFRLPMRYSKRNLRIWLFLVALFMLTFQYIISLILIAFWLYWTIFGKTRQFEVKIMRFYRRYGVAIFWCFTLVFAAVHLSNFSMETLPAHLYLIAIVPQIITGIGLGIVRLRFGFWWAMLMHALFNLIISLLAF